MFDGVDITEDEGVEGTYELTLANGVATYTITVSYQGYTASQSLTATDVYDGGGEVESKLQLVPVADPGAQSFYYSINEGCALYLTPFGTGVEPPIIDDVIYDGRSAKAGELTNEEMAAIFASITIDGAVFNEGGGNWYVQWPDCNAPETYTCVISASYEGSTATVTVVVPVSNDLGN